MAHEQGAVPLRRARQGAGARRRTQGARALRVAIGNPLGRELAAELWRPDTPGPYPVVVFADGWGGGQASPDNLALARALVSFRVAVCLVNPIGDGERTRAESATGRVDDLRAVLGAVCRGDEVDGTRIGVAAAGVGAAIALRLAAVDERIGVLALRSPNLASGEAEVTGVSVPTLLVVDERDEPSRTTAEILLPRLTGGQLEVVRRGDHPFEDAETLATALIVSWLKSHLACARELRT